MGISRFENPKFGGANMISKWIKFTFPVSISDYNTFKSDVYSCIKLKIVLKGLIVVEKRRLIDPVFAVSWTIFRVLWTQDP